MPKPKTVKVERARSCRLCSEPVNTHSEISGTSLNLTLKALRELLNITVFSDPLKPQPFSICKCCSREISCFYTFYLRNKETFVELQRQSEVVQSAEVKVKTEAEPSPDEIFTETFLDTSTPPQLQFEIQFEPECVIKPEISSEETIFDKVPEEFQQVSIPAVDGTLKLEDEIEDSSTLQQRIDFLKKNPKVRGYFKRKSFYKFACFKCNRQHKEERDLQKHLEEVHEVQRIAYNCCGKNRAPVLADAHIAFHLNPLRFKCVACGQVFSEPGGVDHHKPRCNDDVMCPVCLEHMPADQFRAHAKTHPRAPNDKAVKPKPTLNVLGATLVNCELCNDMFLSEEYLQRHMLTRHPTNEVTPIRRRPKKIPQKMYCDFCMTMFTKKDYLRQHMQKHMKFKERPFICEHCGASFSDRSSLTKHVDLQHENNRKQQCPACNKFVKQLKIHYNLHHVKGTPCVCSDCGKSFDNRWQLAKHKHEKLAKQNRSKRRYVCKTCAKTFTTRTMWAEHETAHLGVYSYTCDLCNFQSKYKRNVAKHQKKVHQEHYKTRLATNLKEMYGPDMLPKTLEGNKDKLLALKTLGMLEKVDMEVEEEETN